MPFYARYPANTPPVGGATAANQVIQIGLETQIAANTGERGQQTMANSFPVVIASDQSPVDVNITGGGGPITVDQGAPNTDPNAWPIRITDGTHDALVSVAGAQLVDGSAVTQPISAASLPLPTGAATSANQATEIASLASIDSKTPTLGQKTMAGSSPVVIASDQTAIPVTFGGGSTVTANQGTPNTDTNSWPIHITNGTNDATVDASGHLATNIFSSTGQNLTANGVAGALDVFINNTSIPVRGTGVDGTAVTGTTLLISGSNAGTQRNVAVSAAGHVLVDSSGSSSTSPVNTNGSIVNTALTATTASTASVPANAIGFLFEAPSTNTDNIRWCIGGTASTTVGMLTEPGRDSGFMPCSANISVCSTVSGTNAYSIQWILSS